MKNLRNALLAITLATVSALTFTSRDAISQTFAPNFPQVGAPSYSCGSVNGVSNCTVPAGPAITGSETIPADTNLANGANPQSVKIGVMSLGAGATVVTVPVTGDTITVAATTRQLIVNPAGTIAALTINLPAASASMLNGQRIGICGTQIVTTLTSGAGTGNTFSTTAPTAMLVPVVTGAASCFGYIYEKTSATVGVWHRTQ